MARDIRPGLNRARPELMALSDLITRHGGRARALLDGDAARSSYWSPRVGLADLEELPDVYHHGQPRRMAERIVAEWRLLSCDAVLLGFLTRWLERQGAQGDRIEGGPVRDFIYEMF